MKTLYEKNQLTFALVWIVVYCVLQSLANPLNKAIGVEYAASAGFCILQALALFAFIRKNGLLKRYGLCKSPVPARRFLCYLPLVVLASGNLWNGAALHYAPAETVCQIVCMLCVGFLEEVIFRGLLFVAIARDNVKSAVIISSVTFGIGHIINLFNGSGMDLVSNLCQIVFAIAVGFLLVTIFYRGGSLIPCILAHSAINTLGTFANDASLPTETRLLHLGILIVIAVAYTLILTRTLPEKDNGGGICRRYGRHEAILLSEKIELMEEMMKDTNQLIGCCGLNCETCDARIAALANDNALREKTAALWTKLNGVTITPEMIRCTGCRLDGAKTPFCDRLCPVHNCVREKGLDTCADCGQMDGCPTLGQIAANSPFVLENLKRLKQDNA